MSVMRMFALVGFALSVSACWEPVNRGSPGVLTKITGCGRGAEYVKAARTAGEKVDCVGQGQAKVAAHP